MFGSWLLHHSFIGSLKLWSRITATGRLIMPTDLPAVTERKGKVRAQTRTDITIVVLVWTIIFQIMLVLVQLLADQGFSNPTTNWDYLF
jgi:hypothetical protein